MKLEYAWCVATEALDPNALDTLVTATTAFRSASELLAAMAGGYVPTLRSDRPAPKALGDCLESTGHRVHWMRNRYSYF
jgi:hypothetical protein